MPRTLTSDAIAIWRAGVAAVDSQRLVMNAIHCDGDRLVVCDETMVLSKVGRILVVGGGKAGAGMAAGVEAALGADLVAEKVSGWINVPADCVRPLQKITLHPARPAAVNEPTAAGIFGVEQILKLTGEATANDLVLILISGGGSALLPAPIPGISLDNKLTITRQLSQRGATIQELNAVRMRLSRIKGGGLLRAIPAGRVFVLIISDVIGDPLDVIASGPTVPSSGAIDPMDVLRRFFSDRNHVPDSVWNAIQNPAKEFKVVPRVTAVNRIIGNNRTALDAAAHRAAELGYALRDLGTNHAGLARNVGVEFANACQQALQQRSGPTCLISGGEPVVQLAPSNLPRKGGRNQELILAAGIQLWDSDWSRLTVLSGGTDGEDGPTNAAGAWFDAEIRRRAIELKLDPQSFLAINNSYPFFEQTGGLLVTGPTHTNVMDVRVGLIG